jgi:serine/threonine protein kinase
MGLLSMIIHYVSLVSSMHIVDKLGCRRRVYLVLEYLPHVLSSIIHSHHKVTGGFPMPQFWDILKQLLQTIRFLHQKQVMSKKIQQKSVADDIYYYILDS